MTARDRIVVAVLVTVAVLVVMWMAVVSPERKQAAQLASEVSSAQSQLQSAESQLSSASAAQSQYQDAYAAIVGLGKAVPADEEVPSLIYELARASGEKNVEFASITSGSGGAGSTSAASPTTPAAAGGTFKQMPFTFVFNGTFTSLYDLFNYIDGFAQRTTAGDVAVSGRLLTVQSVKLAPSTSTSTASASKPGSEQLSGTISATAYVLPAGQTLTGGATPAGPASASSPADSSSSSSSSGGSTAPAPAVVEANP